METTLAQGGSPVGAQVPVPVEFEHWAGLSPGRLDEATLICSGAAWPSGRLTCVVQ
jgi:hypothetical protein